MFVKDLVDNERYIMTKEVFCQKYVICFPLKCESIVQAIPKE
jgi:hypothetical protein